MIFSLLPIICSLLFLGLGCFVISHKPHSRQKLLLGFLWIETSVWQAAWAGSFFTSYPFVLSLLSKIAYTFILFLPFTFYDFTLVFLRLDRRKHHVHLFYVFCTVFLVLLWISDWFITGYRVLPWGYYASAGFIHPLYLALSLFALTRSIFLLHRAFTKRQPNAPPQNQIKYIFLALAIYFLAAVDYTPVYGVSIYPFGVFFLLSSFSFMTYAITRHHILDIEVVIKKTLVFAGIVAAAVSAITFPFALIQAVIGKALGVPDPFILMALGIATTVFIYHPVERVLVNLTDKFLFQKKINYRLLLREASEYLAHVDSLKHQARTIVAFLLKKARIANASVYTFAVPDRSALALKASRPLITDQNLKRISLSHPIFEYFSKHQGPLEINTLKESGEDNGKEVLNVQGLNEILALMKSLRAEAAIPCFGGEAASKFDKKKFRLKRYS